MAYVNVAEWKPDQVTEWLKGLDNAVFTYIHSFLNNEVSGQQLLNLRPDDLDHLGVQKLGHQELILEAVEHLRNFHYELDRENLQLLALRLSCRAHSLHNELCQHTDSQPVSTQTLADVANVITAVKPLVCWLDRSPFTGQPDYQDRKGQLLRLGLAMATCAQRDRFAERPVEEIRARCGCLAQLADSIIQDISDPLLLQPASLDLATLKKRPGDDLGFFIVPSFHGVHQIGDIKFSSPAHQCGKVEEGDEVVQVNYQTVVGWQTKKVMALFEESPTDVFLTLKKRPRHTKVYGQIYMKPYRLPSKKRAAPYTRWHENLPSPRPELLTIPDFEMPLPRTVKQTVQTMPASSSEDEDDDPFLTCTAQASPNSVRLYLPKPRPSVQRRATVTGASPTSKRPPVDIEQFWRELRLERHWKDVGGDATREHGCYQLRDKSASVGNDLSCTQPPRPSTCLGIEKPNVLYRRSESECIENREMDRIVEQNNGGAEEGRSALKSFSGKCGSAAFQGAQGDSSAVSDDSAKNSNEIKDYFQHKKCDDCSAHLAKGPPSVPAVLKGESEPRESTTESDSSKESQASASTDIDGKPPVLKERGRLDKSYSTPAYDVTDSEQTGCFDDRPKELQLVLKKRAPKETSSGDSVTEDEHTQRIGEILETINSALLQHRIKEKEMDQKKISCKSSSNPTEDSERACVSNSKIIQEQLTSETSKLEENLEPDNGNSEAQVSETSLNSLPDKKSTPQDCSGVAPLPSTQPSEDSPETIDVTAPEPPPRPATSLVPSRAIMVAKSLGRNAVYKPPAGAGASVLLLSPRSVRKHNALLTKRRNVCVRDLLPVDVDGWLHHRCRSGGAGVTWLRAWFVLKGSTFYGFKTPGSHKADIMIALPGFTSSLADEVKSRKFAFKVYHTGTIFYFAVDTEEELATWLDCITLATVQQEQSKLGRGSDAVFFSETDEDSEHNETETDQEAFFPSPKVRKFAGFLGSAAAARDKASTSRSHHNLSAELNNNEIQKKFGSLKKLGRKVTDSAACSPSHETISSSLDRKYLRFLGGSRTNIVPVPTAQFRSYRRVQNGFTPAKPPHDLNDKCKSFQSDKRLNRDNEMIESCAVDEPCRQTLPQAKKPSSVFDSSTVTRSQFHFSSENVTTSSLERAASDKPQLPSHRQLKVGDRLIHASNPSLQLPSDMADYRLAAERLREFGISRGRRREDTSGFVTLQEFMLNRQEEERRQASAAVPAVSTNQSMSLAQVERDRGNHSTSATNPGRTSTWTNSRLRTEPSKPGAALVRRGSFNTGRLRRNNTSETSAEPSSREYRGGSPEKFWINSLRRNEDITRKPTATVRSNASCEQNNESHTNKQRNLQRLKNAAQYQPPPAQSSRTVHPQDESSRMQLAFEMHLGDARGQDPQKSSKFRSLFTSKTQQQKQNLLDIPSAGVPTQQKTLLGSPRLRRAIFRDKHMLGSKGSTSESSGSSVNSPASPPSDWSVEGFSSHPDPSLAQFKPTMGVAMIGKKPSRRALPCTPSPSSPPPDYPGLEYPPVFEPETYTLSDASSLLRSRHPSTPTDRSSLTPKVQGDLSANQQKK